MPYEHHNRKRGGGVSTDYRMACYTCKAEGPIFASSSIAYGFKVWDIVEIREWLGHRESIGHHEGHDLRVVSEHADLPWENEPKPPGGEK